MTAPSSLSIGGNYSNAGTFTHSGGTVNFDATSTGKTIVTGGTSTGQLFSNVIFNGVGGWTIQTNNMRATGTLNISRVGTFALDSGRTLEINGAYSVCNACTGSTTWTGSTLYLNSGTNYEVGSKNNAAETYGTLQVGASTDIRTWNSTSTVVTVPGTGSLYSQDDGNNDGRLRIYGDYHVGAFSSTTDYWRYDTDFDGATGVTRQVTVEIKSGATTTIDTNGTLDVKGGGGGASQFTSVNTIQGTGSSTFVLSGAGTSSIFETQMSNANFGGGTFTLVNTSTTNISILGGILNKDWYFNIHLVDSATTTDNIQTVGASDITISEADSSSTIFKYTGSAWGSAVTSTNASSSSNGHLAQPNSAGAIRVREFTRASTSSSYYKYNVAVQPQPDYLSYNYYDTYGNNYITSVSSSLSSGVDKVIGNDWYRDTIATENTHPTVNEPPTLGTLLAGLVKVALSFTLDSTSISLALNPSNNHTTTTTNLLTVTSNGAFGYNITAFATDVMRHTADSSRTIAFWPGTNAAPTAWTDICENGASNCGFGYNTNDADLTQFDSTKFAGFSTSSPGDIVAKASASTTNDQTTITYRVSVDSAQPAGTYQTIIRYILAPLF